MKAEPARGKGTHGLARFFAFGTPDYPLIVLSVLLTVFGVVMVFSASYYSSISSSGSPYHYLIRQGFWALAGFIALAFSSVFDYHYLRYLAPFLALAEIGLLLLIWTPLGVTVNGATRWINLGFTLMPGEIAKPVIILLAATYFAADMKRAERFGGVFPIILYTVLVCFLIYLQPNLSTAGTVFFIAYGIAYVAGLKGYWHILLAAGVALLTFYVIFIDTGYQHERIAGFLDPFKDSLGIGFQVVQSLLALGTGGVFGRGITNSVQKTLYLPEPQNDFILAIIGEELGFVGIALLLVLFALLVWRIILIALRSRDNLGMLLAAGVGIMLGFQVVINVAVVTSSAPNTGIALPLISYGGNATMIFLFLIGVVLNVSGQGEKPEEKKKPRPSKEISERSMAADERSA